MAAIHLVHPITGTPEYTYPQISYTFYKKPMARETNMMAKSAMPENIRRETLVNEMIRRLSNVSQDHPDTKENSNEAVNNYMIAMKRSGYSQKIRKETAIAAFKGFRGKRNQAAEEGKPLHRQMKDGAGERFRRKITLKSSWFRKGKKVSPSAQKA